MKKIFIVVHDMKNGGAERVLSVIANYLAGRGYDIYFLAIVDDSVVHALDPRIHFKCVPMMGLYQHQSVGVKLNVMRGIYREMKEIDPDYVLGFNDSLIVLTAPAAKLLRKKFIISERNDPARNTRLLKAATQAAYRCADRIVFQTADARDYFPEPVRKKSVIIPNPLKDNLPYHKSEFSKDIVMACRLRPQKNIPIAIEGFARFHATHPDYRLVIYGEGPLLEELKALARKLGVEESVRFPGHTDNVHAVMTEAGVYLSSSDFEGISNAMLEALAIGLPSVCTDCPVGGARMMIENNVNGILTPVGDADAIAEALSRIADDPEFAASLSRESVKIREKLSTDVICPQWEALL